MYQPRVVSQPSCLHLRSKSLTVSFHRTSYVPGMEVVMGIDVGCLRLTDHSLLLHLCFSKIPLFFYNDPPSVIVTLLPLLVFWFKCLFCGFVCVCFTPCQFPDKSSFVYRDLYNLLFNFNLIDSCVEFLGLTRLFGFLCFLFRSFLLENVSIGLFYVFYICIKQLKWTGVGNGVKKTIILER